MWKSGQSGNPGGRPRGYGEIRELARQHTDTAIETLIRIASDADAPASAQVAAANALLDRGWGRAEASVRLETVESYADVLQRISAEEADEDVLEDVTVLAQH
jgi:hypothetical protein